MPGIDRFAVLSHTLPPSRSVHGIVLDRLLGGLPPERYCLICSGMDDGNSADEVLPERSARRRRLRPPWNRKILSRFDRIPLMDSVNAFFTIGGRAVQVSRILKEERCNLLIACTGELHDLPAACLAARWAGIPFVAYILDDYACQWTGTYRSIARRWEPSVIRSAAGLIVPNEFLQREYRRRYGVDSTVVHNPCPMPELAAIARMPRRDRSGIDIVFTGTVYHAHYDAFHNLITALRLLERDDVRVHIYTSQPQSDLENAGVSGPGVVYHPHVPPSEIPRILHHADILFLPLAFDSPIPDVIRTSAPGKTGEYLSMGKPILVHAPADSYLSWYFRENHCGIVVDQCTPGALAEGIQRLAAGGDAVREMSRRAREMAEKDFSVEKAGGAFHGLLDRILRERPRR